MLSGQLSGAAGNPLFVIELVKALGEQGNLEVHDGRAEVADRSLPASDVSQCASSVRVSAISTSRGRLRVSVGRAAGLLCLPAIVLRLLAVGGWGPAGRQGSGGTGFPSAAGRGGHEGHF